MAAVCLVAGAASCSGGGSPGGAGSARPSAGSAPGGAGPVRAVLYGLDERFVAKGGYASSELVRLDPLALRRQRQRGPLLGDHVNLAVSPEHSVLAAGSAGHGDLVLLNLMSMRRIGRVRIGVAQRPGRRRIPRLARPRQGLRGRGWHRPRGGAAAGVRGQRHR